MSENGRSTSFSECLVLDDSDNGVIIKGITNDTLAVKSGLQAGDKIMAATIHLDHLNKNDVQNILKVLEPYDNNMKVLTKKELTGSVDFGSVGLGLKDSAELLSPQKELSLDTSSGTPAALLDGLNGKLNDLQRLDSEISGPTPSLSINHLKADVTTPQLTTPSASLDIRKPESKPGNLKYNPPKFEMPQLSLPRFKTPEAVGNVDLPSVNGNLEASGPNLSSLKTNPKSPDLDLKLSDVDSSSLDVNLEAPNTNIETPSGKVTWPHQKWKGPKVKGLDANLSADLSPASDVNISKSDTDRNLNAPDGDINLPKADVKSSDVDVQTGKINWPNWKFKKPKLQGSRTDLDMATDVNTPDLYLSSPKIKGDIDLPNPELPKVDLPSTCVDAQAPDVDVDTSGNINWPHLKWGKPKIHSPNTNIETDHCIPDVDVSATSIGGESAPEVKANINAPDANINASSGKFSLPTFKKQKVSGSKVKVPDVDLDSDVLAPELKVSVPEIDGEINAPEAQVLLPKGKADINAPDANTEAPSGKFKFPTLKKQKISGSKVKVPDVDLEADVSAPDLKVSVPKTHGEINAPDAQVNLPKLKADINAPDANINASSGKFRFLTLKKRKVSGSKVKVPDVDLDADVLAPDPKVSVPKTDGEMNAPEAQVNLPKGKADINALDPNTAAPSGKFKFPTLKKQKISGSKVKVPDVDLNADVSAPDLKVSVPKTDGEINAPETQVNLPKLKADINAPDDNINASSSKFRLLTFKKQKVSGSKVKVPDADMETDVLAPELKVSVPKIDGEINAPEAQINLPKGKADINAPDANTEAPSGKFKFPTLKKQKISGSKVKVPDVDLEADVSPPDWKVSVPKTDGEINAPEAQVNLPKGKADMNATDANIEVPSGKFKVPTLKIQKVSGPKVKVPDIDANLDSRREPNNLNLDMCDVHGLPKTVFTSPNVNTELPKADLKGIDVNVKTPKLDTIDPSVELPAGVKASNLSLSAPRIKGDFSPSSLADDLMTDVKEPSVNLPQISDSNFEAPDISLLSPKNVSAKLSNSELKAPDATLTGPNVGINLPTEGLKGPDALIGRPDLDCNSHLGDFKLPRCKFPNLGLSSPEVEVPTVHSSVNVEAPRLNVGSHTGDATTSAPSVDLSELNLEKDIKNPKIDLKAPNVDTSLEKSKGLNFKFPKFGFPGSKTKAPEVNASAKLNVSPDVTVKAPSVETGVSSPDVNVSPLDLKTCLKQPELHVRDEEDTEKKGSQKSKLSWPIKSKSALGNVEDESGVCSEPNMSNADADFPVFKIHRLPRNSINDIGEIGEALNLPKSDAEDKNYVVSKGIRLPILSKSAKIGEKIDIMERLKLAREKVPSPDVNLAGISSLVKGDKSLNENDKLSLGLSNMLGLNSLA
ncbi:neuroblast differentiation-associated protein AHNAK [Betta splendens]|uniref:Neuroblast differentiation-associated protein AHNAK n=1 Tax=Betta splendens TaxID=158456 RepID=A0A6P7PZ04_BETSP|nr:neuroblast differentiation-associated protein AHNAK [Betta splendens]